MQTSNGSVSLSFVVERDKAKTTGATSFPVFHDDGISDSAVFAERLAKRIVCRVPTQVTNIYFRGHDSKRVIV